jgi:hypothetical protein
VNGSQECTGQFVVPSRDGSELLELSHEALDAVPLSIEFLVVPYLLHAITPGRDYRFDFLLPEARLALLGLLVAMGGCGKKQPLYRDQPVAYWRQALNSTDAGARREAANALVALKAKDAVPDLIVTLKDKNDRVRASAAEALWSIGPEAREAVAALLPLLKDLLFSPGFGHFVTSVTAGIATRLERPLPGQDLHLLEQQTFHGAPGPGHQW